MIDHYIHAGVRLCTSFVPRSPHTAEYEALVCGVNLPEGFAKNLFIDTGLIHVMVVSGAHLVFVERLSKRAPAVARWGVVLFYCWFTDWGAPVVRAAISRVVRRWIAPFGWSALQTEGLATLVTLVVSPRWIFSRSFLMSWLCVLALTLPARRGSWRPFRESLTVYAILLPFSLAQPLTVAWNCFVAPTIGRLLFPASLAIMICPRLTPVGDLLWDGLLWLLAHGPRGTRDQWLIPLGWIWWVPWILNFCLCRGERSWRRARAFSSS